MVILDHAQIETLSKSTWSGNKIYARFVDMEDIVDEPSFVNHHPIPRYRLLEVGERQIYCAIRVDQGHLRFPIIRQHISQQAVCPSKSGLYTDYSRDLQAANLLLLQDEIAVASCSRQFSSAVVAVDSDLTKIVSAGRLQVRKQTFPRDLQWIRNCKECVVSANLSPRSYTGY